MNPGEEKVKILLVNDRSDRLLSLEAIIAPLGEEVISAISGKEALRQLMRHDFAVILLDVVMPEMNGFETAELIRQRQRSETTPIIFLTALDQSKEAQLTGYARGAVDFIFTPVDPEVLLAKVKVFIQLYRQGQRIKKQAAELTLVNQELTQEVEDRKKAEKKLRLTERELRKYEAHLEKLVEDRTSELRLTNRRLVEEMEQRRKAEEQALENLRLFQAIFDTSPAAVLVVDFEGRIQRWNKTAERLLGWTEEEALGRLNPSVGPHHWDQFRANLDHLLKGEIISGLDVRRLTKDGREIDLQLTAGPITYEGGQTVGFLGILVDISQRKAAEEKASRLVQAVDQLTEAIFLLDGAKRLIYANPVCESYFGFEIPKASGKKINRLLDPEKNLENWEEAWTGIGQGRPWQKLVSRRNQAGKERLIQVGISSLRNEAGELTGYVGVAQDRTRELALERQLRQSQKMEAIGTLAGGIAHDFNNILGAIFGFSEVALADLPPDSPQREDLAEVIKAANRAKELVRQILTIARRREYEPQPLRLGPIVKEASKLLRASLPTTIEIRIKLVDESGHVLADPTELHQILMNLATNAAQAMKPQGGTLTITLSESLLSLEDVHLRPELKPGSYAVLTVTDTGIGIPTDIKDRIFEPYFTTKPQGEGTGMGLAMVHGIVKAAGGHVSVYSEVGRGTTFNVYFPQVQAQEAQPETAITAPLKGSGRIMLIDDEPALAKSTSMLLKKLGYEVTTFTDSQTAWEAFKARSESFDLVITDQTMPGLTGLALARELKAARPDLPIIICSGFIDETLSSRAAEIGLAPLITKPVGVVEISKAIHAALGEKAAE